MTVKSTSSAIAPSANPTAPSAPSHPRPIPSSRTSASRLAGMPCHDLKVAGRGPARADHPHDVPTRWRRLSEGGGIHPVLVSHARVRHLVLHSADRYLDRAPSLEPGHRPTHSITRLFV